MRVVILLALFLCSCGLKVENFKPAPLVSADTLIEQADSATECGVTESGIWVLAVKPESCPSLNFVEEQTKATEKLGGGLKGEILFRATLIFYGHNFMCDDTYATGCTDPGHAAMIVHGGDKTLRHELFHLLLYSNTGDADVGHTDCWRWHMVDPDREDCAAVKHPLFDGENE